MVWLCVHTCSGGLRPSTFFTAGGKQPDYPIFRKDSCYWNTLFHGTGAYVLGQYKTEAEAYKHVNDWCYTDDQGLLQWARPTVAYERAFR